MDSKARHLVVNGGRRIRKTDLCLKWVLEKTLMSPYKGEGWYLCPYYRQAKMIAWSRLIDMLESQPIKLITGRPNETELSIPLVGGRLMALKGCDKFDSLRGGGPVCAAFDEYAFCDERAYSEVVGPALSDKMAPDLFSSTPNGMEQFNKLWIMGQPGGGHVEGWESWNFPTRIVGTVPLEELERQRIILGPDMFEQEYECRFLAWMGKVVPQFVRKVWPEGNLYPKGDWPMFLKTAFVFGAMDWGIRNQTVVLICAADTTGRVVVFDEIAVAGKTIFEVSRMIGALQVKPEIIVLDKSCWRREGGNLSTIAGQLQGALSPMGIGLLESNSRISDSIEMMKQMCVAPADSPWPRFMVLDGTCHTLVDEITSLQYNKQNKSEESFDRAHNAFDAARYAVMFGAVSDHKEAVERVKGTENRITDEDDGYENYSLHPVSGIPR